MRNATVLMNATVAVAFAIVLSACGSPPIRGASGPVVPAPTPHVGDRWVYHASEGYREKIEWDEVHEVTRIGTSGIDVKVTLTGDRVNYSRTELWSAPGVVQVGAIQEAETRRLDPGWIRYKYPMATGDKWTQSIRDLNQEPGPYGPIQSSVTVGGYESVTTPAGTFDAIKLRYILRLDDETFWRYPTECDYVVWYAPSLGVMVRQQKRSTWMQKGYQAQGSNFGQQTVYELVSFTGGK